MRKHTDTAPFSLPGYWGQVHKGHPRLSGGIHLRRCHLSFQFNRMHCSQSFGLALWISFSFQATLESLGIEPEARSPHVARRVGGAGVCKDAAAPRPVSSQPNVGDSEPHGLVCDSAKTIVFTLHVHLSSNKTADFRRGFRRSAWVISVPTCGRFPSLRGRCASTAGKTCTNAQLTHTFCPHAPPPPPPNTYTHNSLTRLSVRLHKCMLPLYALSVALRAPPRMCVCSRAHAQGPARANACVRSCVRSYVCMDRPVRPLSF